MKYGHVPDFIENPNPFFDVLGWIVRIVLLLALIIAVFF